MLSCRLDISYPGGFGFTWGEFRIDDFTAKTTEQGFPPEYMGGAKIPLYIPADISVIGFFQ